MGIHFAVALVVKNRPIVGVEQYEAIIHTFDGVGQQRHRFLGLGFALTKRVLGVLAPADIQ